MKDKLKQQFKKLHDDCMYTADAHYITATDSKKLDFWLRLIPAILTAFLSVLEVYLQSDSRLLFSLILAAAVTTAVTNVVGAKEKYEIHNEAGRKYTRLKKLCDKAIVLDGTMLDEDSLYSLYNQLLDAYLAVTEETPPTENGAFQRARIRIQKEKIHEPD